MDIKAMHADRAKYLQNWTRNRDHIQGADAVKNKGDIYLPRKTRQTEADHANLIKFTAYYPAASRTLAGLTGLVFRKAPTFDCPDAFEPIAQTITVDGWSIERFSKWAFREYLTTNDGAALVESPTTPEGTSLAKAETLGLNPFITRYPAESILETRYQVINSRKTLIYARLLDSEDQVRELSLRDGAYQVRVHVRTDGDWSNQVFEPRMGGNRLNFIPLALFDDESDEGARMDGLCELNGVHYVKSSLIAAVERWISSPVVFVSGVKDDAEYAYDYGARWSAESEGASADFIRHDGAGITIIEADLERIADQMNGIGSRMLASDKTGAEAAETVARREASGNSIVAMDARHVSAIVTKLARWAAQWKGLNADEVTYTLSTDFAPTMVTESLLRTVDALHDKGKLPTEALFEFLQAGEIINESWDYETYAAYLDQGGDGPI